MNARPRQAAIALPVVQVAIARAGFGQIEGWGFTTLCRNGVITSMGLGSLPRQLQFAVTIMF